MAKGNNTFKFLEGTVVGIALGVAANMFLETKKGKEIKKDGPLRKGSGPGGQ